VTALEMNRLPVSQPRSVTTDACCPLRAHHTDALHSGSIPGGHHIREPHAAQVLGHLTVDLLHVVAAVWDQHLLHDGQLSQPAPAHLYKLHKAAACDFTLSLPNGSQAFVAFCDTDQLLIQGFRTVGTPPAPPAEGSSVQRGPASLY